MSKPCPRVGKWIGGCNFEPRYDEGSGLAAEGNYRGPAGGMERIIQAGKPRTYVHDICTRCGCIVHRPPAPQKQGRG